MRNFFSKLWSVGIVGTFLTGLFVLLPITLTVFVLNWMVGYITDLFGPGSPIGDLLASGGGTLVGPNHQRLAFWAGLLVAIAIVWLIGMLVQSFAKQQLHGGIDRLVERLPFVRAIYRPLAQVVKLFAADDSEEIKGMSVIACRLGGVNGVDMLGLMTSPRVYVVAGQERHLVYLPTAPLPMSGGLLLLPAAQLVPMPAISVDELMQMYLSLGIVTPKALSPDKLAAAAADAGAAGE